MSRTKTAGYVQFRTTLTLLLALVLAFAGLTALPSQAAAAPATPAAVPTMPAQVSTVHSSVMLPTISARCSNGRCTVYLSHAETRAMGNGRVPSPPAWVHPAIRAVYWVTARAHVYIARQYANRGLCSMFRLDIRPWATQGFAARRC